MPSNSEAQPIVGATARLIHAGEWQACHVRELTPDRAVLALDNRLEVGEKVVACVRDVGALAATVESGENGVYEVTLEGGSPDRACRMSNAYGRA